MATRPKMVQRQTVAVSKILEAHCTRGDDGLANYEIGWDDDRVTAEAQIINPVPEHPINPGAVRGLRKNLMGLIRKPFPKKEAPVLAADDGEIPRLKFLAETLLTRMQRVEDEWSEVKTWLAQWEEVMRRRGYAPPPGRPQSTPPDLLEGN